MRYPEGNAMMLRNLLSCSMLLLLLSLFCTPRQELGVLIRMMPDQELYFTSDIVAAFEKEHPYHVKVDRYGSTDSIPEALAAHKGTISVVKIPFDKAHSLIQQNKLALLDTILTPDELSRLKNDYLLTSLGAAGKRPCLIPRKFESRIMVYCKSKVADAVLSWRNHKASADSALARYNGFGLPATYLLEADPEQWDYFDLFMVGWIWSHTMYDGTCQGRMGFRGKRYSGTTQRIYDRIFQLGGDTSAVLSMEGDAVVDAFYWEAVNTASGIYHEKMWSERWSGADIWKQFGSGDVFLSFMTQLDCFFIHGTGSDNLNGYLKHPEDMGVATIPRACSVDLDASGIPLRIGSKSISTGGWWWAIPADVPDSRAAWEFISFITGTSAQIQESTRFGMIPVRKDILGDMAVIFGGGWISVIYETSLKQLMHNGYTSLPQNPNFSSINNCYLDLVDEILVAKKWSKEGQFPERSFILETIAGTFQPKTSEILHRK